jgi:ribonuclease P protein component
MRAERLRRTKDIELVRSHGEMRSDRHFTLRVRANGREIVRVAVASPRSLGHAVERNRARRRVREALRRALDRTSAPRGSDVLIVTRRPALDAPFAVLQAALERHLGDTLGAS